MNIIRLTLTVLLLAVVVVANDAYESIDTTNFANRADSYQGRLVVVSGSVVAINANRKSVQVFDTHSKALIEVSLLNLPKAQRDSLILSPVRNVLVYGKTEVKNGKLSIDAHRVVPQANESIVITGEL